MNEIKFFEKEEFGQVRVTMDKNGDPLFCLADICKAVGLTNSRSVKHRLDKEYVQLVDLHAVNHGNTQIIGNSMANFVTEAGFYDVLISSDSPTVKPFRKWITSEVLPSIRKHGAYMTGDTIKRVLEDPDLLIQLATQLKEERLQRLDAEQKLTVAAPKVDYYDKVLTSTGTYAITQIAKELEVAGSFLNFWLREMGVQYKVNGQWVLYADHQYKGYVKTETLTFDNGHDGLKTIQRSKWTEKGREFIINLYKSKNERS